MGAWTSFGRRVLEGILGLVPAGEKPRVPAPRGAIGRVLVIRPDERIGNLVLLTPLIDSMRREWPLASIDIMVGGAMSGLLAGDPRIRRIHVFDKRRLIENPLRIVPLGATIRRERYDLAVDASHSHQFSLTAALVARVSGAPYRLGYRHGPGRRLLNVGLERNPKDAKDRRYTADLYIELLKVIAPSATSGPLTFPLAPGEAATAEQWIGELAGGNDVRIGIHPGGRGSKRWAVDRFVELVRRVQRPGRRILIFHGPGEERIVERFTGHDAVVVPRRPLREFAAAISRCDVFVSSDTGPMHLAAALGVPTVALFNQGNSDMFGPRGGRNRVIDRPGSPAVEEVLAALESLIADVPGSRRSGEGGITHDASPAPRGS